MQTKTLFLAMFIYISFGVSQIVVSEYEQMLIDHVKWSIEQANRSISKLTPPVLAIHGMTGYPVKHFLNNICSLEGATYLEIGVWKGATFTAALFQNHTLAQAVAIDNWSEFGGPALDFQKNCQLISNIPFMFYNADCFALSLEEIFKAPVDIYFYENILFLRKNVHLLIITKSWRLLLLQ